jgi:hypothetical protein
MMREKVYDVNNKKMLKFDIKDVFSFPYIYNFIIHFSRSKTEVKLKKNNAKKRRKFRSQMTTTFIG